MPAHFTGRLGRIMERAQDEARRFNQDYVSTEHWMLAILADDDSEASAALQLAGVGLKELGDKLSAFLPRQNQASVVIGKLPTSPKAKDALGVAIDAASAAQSSRVSSRMLLIALLHDGETAIQSALRDAGADLDQLRRILTQDGSIPPEE